MMQEKFLHFLPEQEQEEHNLLTLISKYQEAKDFTTKQNIFDFFKKIKKNELSEDLKSFLIKEFEIPEEYFKEPFDIEKILSCLILKPEKNTITTELNESKEKKEKSQQIYTIEIDTLITPPGEQKIQIEKGEKNLKEKEIVDREEMLKKLLEENNEKYFCVQGKKTEQQMMRKQDYKMFVIPSLGKLILICNNTKNATFIINEKIEMPKSFDSKEIKSYLETQKKLEFYCSLTKDQLKTLEKIQLVNQINWSDEKKWKEDILNILTNSIKCENISIEKIKGTIEENIKIERKGMRQTIINFLRGLSKKNLGQNYKALYELAMKELKFSEREYLESTFKDVLSEVRKEKIPKKLTQNVREFLEKLKPEKLREDSKELYDLAISNDIFLLREYSLVKFRDMLCTIRGEKEIDPKELIKSVRNFLEGLSDEGLEQNYKILYKRAMKEILFSEEKYSLDAFRQMFSRIIKGRKI
ncbi:MAG: hypothetical protein AAB526_03235 [Patescibacteria group bacterium]